MPFKRKIPTITKGVRAAIALAAIVFFTWYLSVHLHTVGKRFGYGETDYAVFYVAGASISGSLPIEPTELYDKTKIKPVIGSIRKNKGGTKYLYLPQAALFFAPLSLVPFQKSADAWAILNVAFFVVAYYVSIAQLLRDSPLRIRYSVLLAVLALSDTAMGIFKRGQMNGLVWLLLVLGVVFLSRKKQVLSGVSLACAAALKIFPLIFFPYLLVKKQWVAAASFVATSIALLLASVPFFRLEGLRTFFLHIFPQLLRGSNIGNVAQSTSLFGSFRMAVKDGWFDFFDASRKAIVNTGEDVHLVITLVALCGVFFLLYHNRQRRTPSHFLFEYSLLVLFVLLFAKSIHDDFHLWLLPLLLYVFHLPFTKRYALFHALGAVVLLVTQFSSMLPFAKHATFVMLKAPTAGLLLCFLFVVAAFMAPSKKHLSVVPSLHEKKTMAL